MNCGPGALLSLREAPMLWRSKSPPKQREQKLGKGGRDDGGKCQDTTHVQEMQRRGAMEMMRMPYNKSNNGIAKMQ